MTLKISVVMGVHVCKIVQRYVKYCISFCFNFNIKHGVSCKWETATSFVDCLAIRDKIAPIHSYAYY